jgi:hypothetical protein
MCECSCISWTYLDYAPKFSNKEALIRNFRWYLENLGKFENASGVSHRVPCKQGAVGALKRFFYGGSRRGRFENRPPTS